MLFFQFFLSGRLPIPSIATVNDTPLFVHLRSDTGSFTSLDNGTTLFTHLEDTTGSVTSQSSDTTTFIHLESDTLD